MTLAEFGAVHVAGAPLLLPNAWDVASALAFVEAGFPAVDAAVGVATALREGRAPVTATAYAEAQARLVRFHH